MTKSIIGFIICFGILNIVLKYAHIKKKKKKKKFDIYNHKYIWENIFFYRNPLSKINYNYTMRELNKCEIELYYITQSFNNNKIYKKKSFLEIINRENDLNHLNHIRNNLIELNHLRDMFYYC